MMIIFKKQRPTLTIEEWDSDSHDEALASSVPASPEALIIAIMLVITIINTNDNNDDNNSYTSYYY